MFFACAPCLVGRALFAVRCAPANSRGRPGDGRRPLAFLGGVSFHESLWKEFFTKAGSRPPFHHLILFGACALHVHAETSMCFPDRAQNIWAEAQFNKCYENRRSSTTLRLFEVSLKSFWGYLNRGSELWSLAKTEANYSIVLFCVVNLKTFEFTLKYEIWQENESNSIDLRFRDLALYNTKRMESRLRSPEF